MKINILAGLLLISFLQTECVNNAQKTECVADVQQNERNKGDEPVNLISDEVVGVDSVYKLCIQKMARLIKNPSEKQFFELENEFVYADDYSESLLYNIVAANKRKR